MLCEVPACVLAIGPWPSVIETAFFLLMMPEHGRNVGCNVMGVACLCRIGRALKKMSSGTLLEEAPDEKDLSTLMQRYDGQPLPKIGLYVKVFLISPSNGPRNFTETPGWTRELEGVYLLCVQTPAVFVFLFRVYTTAISSSRFCWRIAMSAPVVCSSTLFLELAYSGTIESVSDDCSVLSVSKANLESLSFASA